MCLLQVGIHKRSCTICLYIFDFVNIIPRFVCSMLGLGCVVLRYGMLICDILGLGCAIYWDWDWGVPISDGFEMGTWGQHAELALLQVAVGRRRGQAEPF